MPEWDWKLSDLKQMTKHQNKVFSCFSCGGGSSMGYKLAGYEVVGNVEIDPQMMSIYKKNHSPKFPFEMPVQTFKDIPNEDLPKELFDLEILDGSPPCSVFSISGKRDKKWGSAHRFREGQATQNLDDLFFDFIDIVDKLKPKIVVAENVKGLITGKARGFVNLILKRFEAAGYDVQIFLLNSATMGVPQKRERVFFIARRNDLDLSKLELQFEESPVTYREIRSGHGRPINTETETYKRWLKRRPQDRNLGDITSRKGGKATSFNTILLHNHRVANTIASGSGLLKYDSPEYATNTDIIRMQTFPSDYDFSDANVQYVCGMSVPPLMMKKIAEQIYLQWLK
ncbi:DNA cytosine methyltransferase [Listeria grayi]|uniref:DNA (cytosine-5-)-methyltransferase n=1 Tax=Listeria grayi FSL F6-1183 TaxID=1265827 RepID=A0A829R995_LISGR|nr:DNA (cytosine-5-)-methyltransferase [Listeria grayi]EUJ30110.1 modification methylase Bsu [Listeria grayi FSL F6-1183]